MSNFKIRKTGVDLHTLKEYNTYGNGAYNAFHDENAPKSVGGTMSKLNNKESKGNCTWYVFGRYQETHGVRLPYEKRQLHAGNWAVDTQTPSVGSIVVFTDSQYGHVAFVESIDGNDIILSESAYSERGNDFLFKYGRTVAEVCNVWGMKVKGYINPPSPSESYDDDIFVPKYKVGDLLEVEDMYENHYSQSIKKFAKVNHLGRGAVYVIGLFPKDNNPYAVSDTKGGAQIGGVREHNVYRINQNDILVGLTAVEKPKPNPPVNNIGKYANMSGKTWLFKVARTDETYHASGSGYNQLTDLRSRSAKILEEDNGRVKVSVSDFNPNIVWVAKSQVSITDSPKYEVS